MRTPRTDRPALLPTIAEVLALPAFRAGLPRVAAGAESLEREVRWVHVVEASDIADLLDGHELLLATGVGWPAGDAWISGYIAELAAAQVAGLVLELGTRYEVAPAALVECCAAQGLPLIVLDHKVKFVSITEAVHGRIIAEQMAALQARDDVHAIFTDLSLRGSPADYIVAQLGEVLGAPVVLENMAHQVVAFEGSGVPEATLLADWEVRSRSAHRGRPDVVADDSRTAVLGAEGWLVTPVEARGTRWGHLIAFSGPAHPAGRALVLEQAAVALSLSRLADGTADHWTQASQHWLLAALLQGRYRSETALRSRFEAMGLPVVGRRLCGVALRVEAPSRTGRGNRFGRGIRDTDGVGPTEVGAPDRPTAADVSRLARSMGLNAVSSWVTSNGPVLLVGLSIPAAARRAVPHPSAPTHAAAATGIHGVDAAVTAFAARLTDLVASGATTSAAPRAMVSAGAVVDHVGELSGSLSTALEVLASVPRGAGTTAGTVHRAQARELRALLNMLRDDPRLQEYLDRCLGTLIDHDATRGTDYLQVLGAYLTHPGNRTLAASSSHMSRSVFYQRLDAIADLLGVDLADGEVIAGLHAAMIAWEGTQSGTSRTGQGA
ncbi:PucR family transcriptional regulator [Specibacter sp. RAF43]|uniref:PucR family transcriptional regulator n=1 Tax=Specibacter sp. RAF43 TaxID=3233057 RepID=UPI003F9B6BFD